MQPGFLPLWKNAFLNSKPPVLQTKSGVCLRSLLLHFQDTNWARCKFTIVIFEMGVWSLPEDMTLEVLNCKWWALGRQEHSGPLQHPLEAGELPINPRGTALSSSPKKSKSYFKKWLFGPSQHYPVYYWGRERASLTCSYPACLFCMCFIETTLVSCCCSSNLAVPAHFNSMEVCPNIKLTNFQL